MKDNIYGIFYKGAGVGTYWHKNDARNQGFRATRPTVLHSLDRLMQHIARGSTVSPYISLTRSYGIAYRYAVSGRLMATTDNPGVVYEIEIEDHLPENLKLLDPIKEVVAEVPNPLASIPYQHDGDMEFLLGVINPKMNENLIRPVKQPPPRSGTPRPANLSTELETIVLSLRDSEILAMGHIPAGCIRNRYDEFEISEEN